MNIEIIKAQKSDMDAIYEVELNSFHPDLQAPKEALEERLDIFGIWAARVDKKIAGFYTCVPTYLNCPTSLDPRGSDELVKKLKKNRHPDYKKYIEEYSYGKEYNYFNTFFVTSTAVAREFQNKGIGRELIFHSLELANKTNLMYRASVLRAPGYSLWENIERNRDAIPSINKYINIGKERSEPWSDRILSLYHSIGFHIACPIHNYQSDKDSGYYGIFAYMETKEYKRLQQFWHSSYLLAEKISEAKIS